MRVLVTGGAGFIGSHVVDALVHRGDTVIILDDLSSGSLENLAHAKGADGKGVTLVHRSITQLLDDVFEKAKPEAVVHLAAQIDVRKSIENPKHDADVNIIGALNLLATCHRHGVKRIVFSSTGGALYGETDVLPTPEDYPITPENPYGIAKRSVEFYLEFYRAVHGLEPTVLRFANVYGPRQALKGEAGVVALFTKALLRGEQPTVFGDGKQTRDYVYVDDVVDAVLAVLDKHVLGAYNVGTGVETSVNELYRALAKLLDNPWAAKHGPAIPGELQRSALDASAFTKATGWKPQVELDHGLAKTVAWFKERGANKH
jgi:UDP-glucose 4-epimerase